MLGRKSRTGTRQTKILYAFGWSCPGATFAYFYSMAVLYHVNGKLQRAYSWILCKTTTLHVQHIFLHISLPSLYDYDMKSPGSTFWVNVNKRWRNFSLSLAFNLDMVLRNSTPEEFACIRQRRWVGIIAIEIEKLQVSPCKIPVVAVVVS